MSQPPHARDVHGAAEFFRRLPSQLKSTASRFNVRGDDFDELCQQVIFKLMTSEKWQVDYRADDPAMIEQLLAYASGIARRQICDNYRRKRSTLSLANLSDTPSPAADPRWSIQSDDLWAALDKDATAVAPPPPVEFIRTYLATWRSQGSVSSAEMQAWEKEFKRNRSSIYNWKGLIEDAVAGRIHNEMSGGPL